MNKLRGMEVIAQRPPLCPLFKAFLLLVLGALSGWGIVAMVTSEKRLLSPSEGAVFWIRLVVLLIMLAITVWFWLLLLRIVSRWTLSGAGIFTGGGRIKFCIPVTQGRWNPFLGVEEKDLPLAGIHGTRFNVGSKSSLTIETDAGTLEIPSGTFAVGGYSLDARLRELAPHEGSAVLKPMAPRAFWAASSKKRLAMLIVGLMLLAVPLVLTALIPSGDPSAYKAAAKVSTPFFLGSIALLTLAALYRGHVAIDERGIFYERSGTVSFLSEEALAKGSVRISRELLGLWATLDIRSASTFKRSPICRIRLNRILGLGWPLKQIQEALPHKDRG